MFDRLERIAPLLFENHANIILAHGLARFNEKFAAYKKAGVDGYEEDGFTAYVGMNRGRHNTGLASIYVPRIREMT